MASKHVERLTARFERTAARIVAQATADGLSVRDLPAMRLRWYEMRDAGAPPERGGDPDHATVLIYDEIGGSFGVSARQFAEDLEELSAEVIHLRINSPGGSVFDARAIANSLRHHPARVEGFVDGLCASAATIVAMAADTLTVMPGGEMMVHDASGMEDGNPRDHEAMATFLHRESQNEAENYAEKSGGSADEWRELMIAETWMFGSEAVALGLADAVWTRPEPEPEPDDGGFAELMTRRHNLDLWPYQYRGRGQAPSPAEVRRNIRARKSPATTRSRDRAPQPLDAPRTAAAWRAQAAQERAAAAVLRQRVADAGRLQRGALLGASLGRELGLGERIERAGELVTLRGRQFYRTSGYFTAYGMPYEMWDALGPYFETMFAESGAASLAQDPLDVPFVINHTGLTLARTAGPWNDYRGTLELTEDDHGGFHVGYLNPERDETRGLISAIDDQLITEMSFRFLIIDGKWDDQFQNFGIRQYDVHRGDVSAVNLGANPFTDISARAQQLMQDLDNLPMGAIGEVQRRLEWRINQYTDLVRGLDAPDLVRVADFAEAARGDDPGARAVANSLGRDIIRKLDRGYPSDGNRGDQRVPESVDPAADFAETIAAKLAASRAGNGGDVRFADGGAVDVDQPAAGDDQAPAPDAHQGKVHTFDDIEALLRSM
jgi:HK97 family phage prohead protease